MLDEQYDAEVTGHLTGIKEIALQYLGLDLEEVQEIAPISFESYIIEGSSKSKRGKDNVLRTNKYEYTLLFFTEYGVYCFKYIFDTTNDSVPPRFTMDLYFYKDIAVISITNESVTLGKEVVTHDTFRLFTTAGIGITAWMHNIDNAWRSINAMRALLVSKKREG